LAGIKEITVFTLGDANELKAWSNVPYFFTKSLEQKGIRVNRVNIEENPYLFKIYKYSIFAFLKLLKRNSDHNYFRAGLNNFLTNKKIQKAIRTFPNSDAFLFLTYSFSAKTFSRKKTILFSDWSYLYFIKHFLGREPLWFEKNALRREKKNIETADQVMGLFPRSNEFNTKNYDTSHCVYLGNVINSDRWPDKHEVIKLKQKSQSLLFIGNAKYIQGAKDLVTAFKLVHSNYNEMELHIIGLDENELGLKQENLFCHGYLDKGNPAENELYYKLLSKARMIINTNEAWGAFSAMTEAMFYYTPVITSPYAEFTKTYGKEIDFGYYVNSSSAGQLSTKIEELLLLSEPKMFAFMQNAHEKVKDFTWDNYTMRFLDLLSK
jgi:glycosyltransferase involved in cell wall biosynthesis